MSGADTRFGARRSGVLLLAVTATLTTLAACRRVDDETARMLSEPGERHAIGYSKGQALLHVEAGPTQGGLSDNQRGDVLGFLQRYREQGTGPLHVSLPTTARGHMIAQGASREIRGLARQVGVAPDQVVVARHGVAGAEPPAVIVSFFRPVAVPPVCGDWSADLGRDHERVRHPQFGCATQRNLALTVANSRDLEQPQEEMPASSERRYQAWTKYVGTAPGAAVTPVADAKKPTTKTPAAPPATQ